jgi:hypothetical protein
MKNYLEKILPRIQRSAERDKINAVMDKRRSMALYSNSGSSRLQPEESNSSLVHLY